MTRRIAIVLVLLASGFAGLSAQTTTETIIDSVMSPLETDLETVFHGIGRDIEPVLLHQALVGDLLADATLGPFPSFHLQLPIPGIGVSTVSGIGGFIESTDFESELVDIGQLIQGLASSAPGDVYELVTTKVAPIPALRFAVGAGITETVDTVLTGSLIPKALTSWGVGLANLSQLSPLELSTFTLKSVTRLALVQDQGPYPAFSVGAGFAAGRFTLGYSAASLDDLLDAPVDLSGLGTLSVNDIGLSVGTSLLAGGLDIHVSKRLLFLTLFAKISPWYRITNYHVAVSGSANVLDTNGAKLLGTDYVLDVAPAPVSSSDFSVILTSGFELRVWVLVFHTSLSLDFEQLVLSFADTTFQGVGANVGIRIAF